MKQERRTKTIFIILLCVVMLSFSVGFALFSTTIKVSSSADVDPNPDRFNIVVSGSKDNRYDLIIEPEITGGATAENGIIYNGEGVSTMSATVNFTKPGQIVNYTAYIHNIGRYTAYLKRLEFLPVEGSEVGKICIAGEGAREDLVQEACESISIKMLLGVGNSYYTYDKTTDFSTIGLERERTGTGIVSITYAENGVEVDGPFQVKFGDIKIYYSTAD